MSISCKYMEMNAERGTSVEGSFFCTNKESKHYDKNITNVDCNQKSCPFYEEQEFSIG